MVETDAGCKNTARRTISAALGKSAERGRDLALLAVVLAPAVVDTGGVAVSRQTLRLAEQTYINW